ncbi:facilitated trehalose transporter Tret1-like isoform X2 [Leguminivora glycinivorella]|nr:facilitated trehalose transporter Tret1-like isoform X2 [Leguminivora glycinivorella]
MMIVGRILQGAAGGMMMPLRSVLVSEYCSPHHRGAFLTGVSLAQTAGVLLVHFLGSLITYRMTALVSMSFSFIALLVTVYSPETPSWLAVNRQYDKCRENFIWLRSDEEMPELEKMILASKRLDEITKGRNMLKEILDFAKRKECYKPIVLMSAVYSMTNFTNTILIVVYPMLILKALMGTEDYAPAWLLALDVQSIVFSCVSVYVTHKVRRRTLLLSSGSFTTGTQLALAVYIFAKNKDWLPFDSMWIPGALLSAHTMSVYIGVLPLGSVIAGEVFPLQFRSYCESISLFSVYATAFIVLKTFLDLTSGAGVDVAFGVYSGAAALCLAAAAALLPETRGRTLQQIEEHFRGAPLVDPEVDTKETKPLNEFDEVDRQCV